MGGEEVEEEPEEWDKGPGEGGEVSGRISRGKDLGKNTAETKGSHVNLQEGVEGIMENEEEDRVCW